MSNISLECRQLDSNNVINNGDWCTTLSTPTRIDDGDTMVISRSFIDTVSDSNSQIVIPDDIEASIQFYIYTSGITHEGVATLADEGKLYTGVPLRNTDPQYGVDGFDYLLCTNSGANPYPADVKLITKISLRSDRNNNTTPYMGDISPNKNNPLLLAIF